MFKIPEARLFQYLCIARREVATELGVGHRFVFTDATLWEIARTRPQTDAQWLAIPGVTASKLAQYGDRFRSMVPPNCQWCGHRETIEDQLQACSAECQRKLEGSDWDPVSGWPAPL